jgi:hypothetical protein
LACPRAGGRTRSPSSLLSPVPVSFDVACFHPQWLEAHFSRAISCDAEQQLQFPSRVVIRKHKPRRFSTLIFFAKTASLSENFRSLQGSARTLKLPQAFQIKPLSLKFLTRQHPSPTRTISRKIVSGGLRRSARRIGRTTLQRDTLGPSPVYRVRGRSTFPLTSRSLPI